MATRLPPLAAANKTSSRSTLAKVGAGGLTKSSSAPVLAKLAKGGGGGAKQRWKLLKMVQKTGLLVKGGKVHAYHKNIAHGKSRVKNKFGNSTTFIEIDSINHTYMFDMKKPEEKEHEEIDIAQMEEQLMKATAEEGRELTRNRRNSLMVFKTLDEKHNYLASLNDKYLVKQKTQELAKRKRRRPGSAKPTSRDPESPEKIAARKKQLEDNKHRIATVGMTERQLRRYWQKQRNEQSIAKRKKLFTDEISQAYDDQRNLCRRKREQAKVVLQKRLVEMEEARKEQELQKRIKEAVLKEREREKAIDIKQYLQQKYGDKF